MKANVTLLLAVLFALVFYTSSLKSQNQPKAAAPSAAPTAASKQNTKKNIPNPKNSPAKPAPQAKKGSQPASPAKPTPVKLCAFNKIGMVPGSPIHKFSVLELQSSKYENKHFDVTWREQKNKHHKFFTWIQKQASFSQNFPKMKCQVADKAAFGKTCNYQPAQLDQFYANAFGKDIIFKCVVPDNSFVLTTRFVLQLSDFATSAGGRWSVFAGLYQFKSAEDAKKTIQKQAKSIRKEITSSQLSTFDINSNLNIIPQFVKGTLSWVFSSNINSNYHRTVKKNNPYDLSDVGYVKILPPGTEFIIGSIYNGTTSVKQICDNYRFDDVNDDCRLKI